MCSSHLAFGILHAGSNLASPLVLLCSVPCSTVITCSPTIDGDPFPKHRLWIGALRHGTGQQPMPSARSISILSTRTCFMPSWPLLARPRSAQRAAARRAPAVRAATAIARGNAAHSVHQCVSLCCLYTAFCTVVCAVCRTYSVWDSGHDFEVIGTLFIMYCYHTYPRQSHFFIHCAL